MLKIVAHTFSAEGIGSDGVAIPSSGLGAHTPRRVHRVRWAIGAALLAMLGGLAPTLLRSKPVVEGFWEVDRGSTFERLDSRFVKHDVMGASLSQSAIESGNFEEWSRLFCSRLRLESDPESKKSRYVLLYETREHPTSWTSCTPFNMSNPQRLTHAHIASGAWARDGRTITLDVSDTFFAHDSLEGSVHATKIELRDTRSGQVVVFRRSAFPRALRLETGDRPRLDSYDFGVPDTLSPRSAQLAATLLGDARRCIQAIDANNPGGAQARDDLARLYAITGDFENALATANEQPTPRARAITLASVATAAALRAEEHRYADMRPDATPDAWKQSRAYTAAMEAIASCNDLLPQLPKDADAIVRCGIARSYEYLGDREAAARQWQFATGASALAGGNVRLRVINERLKSGNIDGAFAEATALIATDSGLRSAAALAAVDALVRARAWDSAAKVIDQFAGGRLVDTDTQQEMIVALGQGTAKNGLFDMASSLSNNRLLDEDHRDYIRAAMCMQLADDRRLEEACAEYSRLTGAYNLSTCAAHIARAYAIDAKPDDARRWMEAAESHAATAPEEILDMASFEMALCSVPMHGAAALRRVDSMRTPYFAMVTASAIGAMLRCGEGNISQPAWNEAFVRCGQIFEDPALRYASFAIFGEMLTRYSADAENAAYPYLERSRQPLDMAAVLIGAARSQLGTEEALDPLVRGF